MRPAWLGRIVGLLWIAAWVGALHLVASPWRHLGGVVSERLRWLESFVLLYGAVLGFALGDAIREGARPDSWRRWARTVRWGLYPAAVLTAALLVVLRLLGEGELIGVAFTAFLSYWAGLDLASSALPLVRGRLLEEEQNG